VPEDNVTYSTRIEAEASEADILALIEQTDRVAEIPNSLRLGTPVLLTGGSGHPGWKVSWRIEHPAWGAVLFCK
jgi:hypothetical protein